VRATGLNMATLESRLAKLEGAVPPENAIFEEFVRQLPHVDSAGAFDWQACPEFVETMGTWLAQLGNEARDDQLDPIERGIARLLFLFENSADPFIFERYRNRVPDRVLTALYGRMRNYAFPPDAAARVRLLAGIASPADNCRLPDVRTVGHE
jgi:hypothetical protein